MNQAEFNKLVKRYLRDLQDTYDRIPSGSSNELALRPILYGFVEELSLGIDPARAESVNENPESYGTKPDITIKDKTILGKPLFGLVEHKNLDPKKTLGSKDITSHRQQLEGHLKYIANKTQKLLLTDGIDFIILGTNCFQNEPVAFELVSIAKKPLPEKWETAEINAALLSRFKELLLKPGASMCSPEDVVCSLAGIASELSESIAEILDSSPSNSKQEEVKKALRSLQTSMELNSDARLESKTLFSDFASEVLVFGLFHAHFELESKEEGLGSIGIPNPERKQFLEEYWAKFEELPRKTGLRPFSAVWAALKASGLNQQINKILDLLAHADVGRHIVPPLDFHSLYQAFVKARGRETWEFGEFMTPVELVKWMARMTVSLTSSDLGLSLFANGNKIIDPACGTGTFIEEILNLSSEKKNDDSLILRGFEIQAVPHALATRRLWDLAKHKGVEANSGFFLCDTLSDRLADDERPKSKKDFSQIQQYLFDDFSEAWDSAHPPLVAVIGNPPATPKAQGQFAAERRRNRKIIERLAKEWQSAGKNTARAMKNEWALFLRWSVERLESSKGIMCLVVPESLLESVSFTASRKSMLEKFSRIIVLEVDEDLRRQSNSGNQLFTGVRQGRVVLVATKKSPSRKGNPRNTPIFYHTITDKDVTAKKQFLISQPYSKGANLLASFVEIPKGAERETRSFSFRPSRGIPDLYSVFWPLHSTSKDTSLNAIFEEAKGGLKLAPVPLSIAPDVDVLSERSNYISKGQAGNWKFTVDEIKEKWYKGQRKPPNDKKFTDNVRVEIGKASKKVISYSYRPFVRSYCLQQTPGLQSALRNAGGKSSGYRYKADIVDTMSKHGAYGIAVSGGTRELSDDLQQFATFCWNIPDNDLSARTNAFIHLEVKEDGSSNVCPALVKHAKAVVASGVNPQVGSDNELKTQWNELCGWAKKSPSRIFLFYSYAVLCSEALVERFAGAYHSTSNPNSRYRIPVASDPDAFARLATLGWILAKLEDWEDQSIWKASTQVTPKMSFVLPARQGKKDNPFIPQTAGPSCLKQAKLETYANGGIDYARIRLTSEGTDFLIEELPPEVASVNICGYNVVESWLREKTFPYLRRNLRVRDIEELVSLLWRLERRALLIEELDIWLEQVLKQGDSGLVLP